MRCPFDAIWKRPFLRPSQRQRAKAAARTSTPRMLCCRESRRPSRPEAAAEADGATGRVVDEAEAADWLCRRIAPSPRNALQTTQLRNPQSRRCCPMTLRHPMSLHRKRMILQSPAQTNINLSRLSASAMHHRRRNPSRRRPRQKMSTPIGPRRSRTQCRHETGVVAGAKAEAEADRLPGREGADRNLEDAAEAEGVSRSHERRQKKPNARSSPWAWTWSGSSTCCPRRGTSSSTC